MKIPYFCCIGAELKRYAKDFDFMNQVYLYKVPTDDSIEEVLAEDYFKAISDSVLQDDLVYIYEASAETLHSCRFDKQNGHITAVPLASDETLTGAVTTIIHDNLTPNKVLISDRNGKVAASDLNESDIGNLVGKVQDIEEKIPDEASSTNKLADKNYVDDGLENIQDQVDALKARGRFLSIWNCVTGLAETTPSSSPYVYKTGDYFIVGTIGTTNYKPTGSSYSPTPSTTVETGTVKVNDTYYYDGTDWILLDSTTTPTLFANIVGSPYDNTNLAQALNEKANVDLDNLSTTGEARFAGKANLALDNLTSAGVNKLGPQVYQVMGYVVNSVTAGSAVAAYGVCRVELYPNGLAIVDFNLRFTAPGTSGDFNWGLNRDILHNLNANIPIITPIDGTCSYYDASGIYSDNLNGYSGALTSGNQFWTFGRLYDTAGNIGGWGASQMSADIKVVGRCYGTYTA